MLYFTYQTAFCNNISLPTIKTLYSKYLLMKQIKETKFTIEANGINHKDEICRNMN